MDKMVIKFYLDILSFFICFPYFLCPIGTEMQRIPYEVQSKGGGKQLADFRVQKVLFVRGKIFPIVFELLTHTLAWS